MTDYFYDMDLVVDPLNPSNVVANGLVSIYDPADTAGTTLLALKDPSGLPLPNPLPSNANGFLPPRSATVPQTMWKSGGFTGYFNSYKGLRDESVAAVSAAQAAANDAASAASEVVTTAAVDGSGNLKLTKASGTVVNAGSVVGPQGPKGDTGAAGLNGSNVLPTDTAIQQAINDTASATRGALNATYVPKWKANTAYLAGDAVLSPSGDTVTAKADFTSGASFSGSNWNYSPTYAGLPSNGRNGLTKEFYPEGFGAKGDGTTDDKTALRTAITAAQAFTAGNSLGVAGVVRLTSTYLTSGQLDVTAKLSIVGQGQSVSKILVAPGFTDAHVIYVHPTVKTQVELREFGIDDPGVTTNLISVTNVSGGTFDKLRLLGGLKTINILSSHHNSKWSNVIISRVGDYAVDIQGDTATAELWFSNFDIGGVGSGARTVTAAVRILRATAGDIGGYYFSNFLAAFGAQACTYGMLLDGSAITSGKATSPVFLQGNCAFDGVSTPFAANNWGNMYSVGTWFSSDDAAADCIQFTGCNDAIFSSNAVRGGANGFAFRGAQSSHIQVSMNRIPDAAYAYYLDSSTALTAFSYAMDDLLNGGFGGNISNNMTWLARASATAVHSGMTLLTSDNAESSLAFRAPTGERTHMRRTSTELQWLDSAYGSVIASLSNTGGLRAKFLTPNYPMVCPGSKLDAVSGGATVYSSASTPNTNKWAGMTFPDTEVVTSTVMVAPGGSTTATIYWTTSLVSSGNVRWQLSLSKLASGNSVSASTVSNSATTAVPSQGVIAATTISLTGLTPAQPNLLRVIRLGADALDTCTDPVIVLGVAFADPTPL